VYFKPPETKVLFNLEHVFPAMEFTALVVVVEEVTPLFQINRVPDFEHVYFKPPETKVLFNLLQLRPKIVLVFTVDVVEIS
jgi:hypothetical protein